MSPSLPCSTLLATLLLAGCHRDAPAADNHVAEPVNPTTLDASTPANTALVADASLPDAVVAPTPTGGGTPVTVVVPREAAGELVVRVDGRTLTGARGENGAFRCQPEALTRGAHLVVVQRPACGASASRYVFVDSDQPREFIAAAPTCP